MHTTIPGHTNADIYTSIRRWRGQISVYMYGSSHIWASAFQPAVQTRFPQALPSATSTPHLSAEELDYIRTLDKEKHLPDPDPWQDGEAPQEKGLLAPDCC